MTTRIGFLVIIALVISSFPKAGWAQIGNAARLRLRALRFSSLHQLHERDDRAAREAIDALAESSEPVEAIILGDESSVVRLGRLVAAEAGGDQWAGMDAKVAVAAATIRYIKKTLNVAQVQAKDVDTLLAKQPWFVSSYQDSNRYLYTKDAAWLRANGFASALVAAVRALSGSDPSNGADHWYDSSISNPYPGKNIITARLSSGAKTIVFYKFKPGYQ